MLNPCFPASTTTTSFPMWSEWSSYSECTQVFGRNSMPSALPMQTPNCGYGIRSRKRLCLVDGQPVPNNRCHGAAFVSTQCILQNCSSQTTTTTSRLGKPHPSFILQSLQGQFLQSLRFRHGDKHRIQTSELLVILVILFKHMRKWTDDALSKMSAERRGLRRSDIGAENLRRPHVLRQSK